MSSTSPPLCRWCKHYTGSGCAAFASIPEDIFTGAADHRQPHEGDHGIRFEEGDIPVPESVTDALDYITEARARAARGENPLG